MTSRVNAIQSDVPRPASKRGISPGAAFAACLVSACLAGGGALASASGLPTGTTVRPGPPFRIAGYGYTCDSTSRTPNWSCDYGRPYGPAAGTPIMTVYEGSRSMYVQSLRRPTISEVGGVYTTKISR